GRHAVNAFIILSCAVSLLGTAAVLRQARHYSPGTRDLFVGLCILAVASSWCLTQAMFTLRYAHLYYHDDHEGVGGLEFPGRGHPAYLDFAYFSFTIGMCFQVSDVTISSPRSGAPCWGTACSASSTTRSSWRPPSTWPWGSSVDGDDDVAGEVELDVLGRRRLQLVAPRSEQLKLGGGVHGLAVRPLGGGDVGHVPAVLRHVIERDGHLGPLVVDQVNDRLLQLVGVDLERRQVERAAPDA